MLMHGKIIDLLEMREIADAAIGKTGAGLNQEQRKRLTIGVELGMELSVPYGNHC